MSLSHDELVYLLAYVDGQVDDDEVPEVEALLAKSEEARQLVAELGAVGDWVRTTSTEKAVAAGADEIVDVVMAEVAELGGGKVITLERERARRALNRQRVKEFGALAAVAAVVFLVWGWPDKASQTQPEAVAKGPALVSPSLSSPMASPAPPGGKVPERVAAAAPADSSPPLAVGSEEGVDVESVESPHGVSVFYLPVTNKNAASVVVWIGESEEVH